MFDSRNSRASVPFESRGLFSWGRRGGSGEERKKKGKRNLDQIKILGPESFSLSIASEFTLSKWL